MIPMVKRHIHSEKEKKMIDRKKDTNIDRYMRRRLLSYFKLKFEIERIIIQ